MSFLEVCACAPPVAGVKGMQAAPEIRVRLMNRRAKDVGELAQMDAVEMKALKPAQAGVRFDEMAYDKAKAVDISLPFNLGQYCL
ncbi:MAG TPA: hypothetical protein VKT52_06580, partial [Ktedonobacterales bacterium]|nr:hypothetical protein [Ktedonobacterales bacterium]